MLKIAERKQDRKYGARKWMTRADIARKYQDKSIADEICNSKLSDPDTALTHTKPHPDSPQNEAGAISLLYV